jgi:hypothetical protein
MSDNETKPERLPADVEAALAEPFQQGEIVKRSGQGGGSFAYIEAPVIQRRLDKVVGVFGWSDDYAVVYAGPPGARPVKKSDTKTGVITETEVYYQHVAVQCRLTILGVMHCDCGEAMEEAEPFKAAHTDALKRAAAKFGIGLDLKPSKAQKPRAQPASAPRAQAAPPASNGNGHAASPPPAKDGKSEPPARPGGHLTEDQRRELLSDYPDGVANAGAFISTALDRFGFLSGKSGLEEVLIASYPEDRRPKSITWSAADPQIFARFWMALRLHERKIQPELSIR